MISIYNKTEIKGENDRGWDRTIDLVINSHT